MNATLGETIECSSSMIMYSTSLTMGWNRGDVMAMARLSGVVMRIWGGLRSIFCRSDCEVSPVKTDPNFLGVQSGGILSDFIQRSDEVALDIVGKGLDGRDVDGVNLLLQLLLQR